MTSSLRTNSAAILSYSFAPAIGDTKMSAILNDHNGWLICDGRLLDKVVHKHLFDVIGYTFGGSGATFRLPDAQGRVAGAIGDDGNGIGGDLVWMRGDIAGTQRETIDISEMPSHTHDISTGYTGITLGLSGEHTHTVDNTGLYNLKNTTDGSVDDGQNEPNLYAGPQTTISSSNGLHSHIVNDPGHIHIAGHTGGSQPINIMQPTIFIGNLFIYSGRPKYPSNILYPSHRIVYY